MLLPSLQMSEVPIQTDSVSLFPWSDRLARRFVLTSRFGDPYSLYGRRGSCIELPRGVCPVADNDCRDEGLPVDFNLVVGSKNGEQAKLCERMTNLLLKGESFILRAGTGTGKTWLGSAAVAAVGRKALIIVPKQDLMDQWRERLKMFLGLKDHDIGRIQSNKVSVIGKKVVIGMVHSVAMQDRYPEGTFDDFGLVVFR